MKKTHNNKKQEQGSVLVSILFLTVFLSIMLYSLMILANVNIKRAESRILVLQTQYAAESAADTAIAYLNSTNGSYSGTGGDIELINTARYRATYTVSVTAGADAKEKIVTATGKVYQPSNASTPKYTKSVEVVVQRTSTTSATSIVSKNIIQTASSIKSVIATDIYVNNYIQMNKNTTDLIAENITVAGRNTSSSNCSIGGSGNLVKPSSFTDPTQTKTNIRVAFNNCISPPGNTSNANFDVLANQSDITKIQTTFIPWSQYMDNSYQNSPGGCSDWTSGASPRNIPSTGNTKKTHYPDSASGVVTSCGTSGSLALGSNQYNIRDHIHIRANLCAASACGPIFYNPDTGAAGIKFIFVEGTVNFSNVRTATGSGPIVIVAYGADPASLASVCPLGGAIHLGATASGSVNAPELYLLANNGLCMEKTKFGSASALGGVSGKNIYIDTNSGTPFDLKLNTSFPLDSIPVDLSWRAIRYSKL